MRGVIALDKHVRKFNTIAFIYQWFFRIQIKFYQQNVKTNQDKLEIEEGDKILDLGCGTGAFSYTFKKFSYDVSGIDASPAMVRRARKNGVEAIQGNVLNRLPFPDNSFDLVTAAFVVHGLDLDERIKFYQEAQRLSRNNVLIHDYNQADYFLINIIEAIEGGSYFSFKENAVNEMEQVFEKVKVYGIGPWSCWYICS